MTVLATVATSDGYQVPEPHSVFFRSNQLVLLLSSNCRHFGERANKDDIAGMEGRAVRWMSAVADTSDDMMMIK